MTEQERDALFAEFREQLQVQMDRLRQTAAEMKAGTINQWHAANRIAKIANEVCAAKDGAK